MRQDVGNGEAFCLERGEAFFEGEDLGIVRREEAAEVGEQAFYA